jgi:hypothetical protein
LPAESYEMENDVLTTFINPLFLIINFPLFYVL